MAIVGQKTFVGGMDMISDDTQIQPDSYEWLVNGRTRFGKVAPIKRHRKLTNAPVGKKQGIIAVGNVLVLFVAGRAYYQQDGASVWVMIPGFTMDATVDQYWTERVPASYFHFVRNLNADGNIHSPMYVTTDFKISGTPAAIVVQDGINQPWLIIYDNVNQIFTSRVTKNYNQWQNQSITADDREYVPIGKQMMYLEGILYVVAPSGKAIYRSITGRPLDFMVNVDTDGNKQPTETEGGAETVSFAFDFNEITCIYPINIPGSFIYGTYKNVRIVSTNLNTTIFGEPTYGVAALIESGIVNNNSVMEILGDYMFIDAKHIKSFNAVQAIKFQGRNSIFSLQLAKILEGRKQRRPICIEFNNYALFNVDTIWGNGIATFDILRNKWNSFDVTDVIRIKQFAIVELTDVSKLYCITRYDEVFQMFAAETSTYLTVLKPRSFASQETAIEHSSQYFRPFFKGGQVVGNVTLTGYVDDQLDRETSKIGEITKPLFESLAGIFYPVIAPVVPDNKSRSDNPGFMIKDGLRGKKLSFIIKWDNDAELVEFELETSEVKKLESHKQQNKIYKDKYGSNG